MSHLIHIIEVKQFLTEAGVTCAKQQSELLNEAFVRALVCYRYSNGHTTWNEELDKRIWTQLEKWNGITPIPAQFIHASAQKRCNEVFGAMANRGVPPAASVYEVRFGKDGDLGSTEVFNNLVGFLKRELGAGHE